MGRKSALEDVANSATVKVLEPFNRLERACLVLDDEPRLSVIDDFRHRAPSERNDRGTARHCLDHHQTEGLWPIDGKEQRRCISEKVFFGAVVDLANQLDLLAIDHGLELLFEVTSFSPRNLGSYSKRHLRCARNPNGDLSPLVRGEASKKGEIRNSVEAGS